MKTPPPSNGELSLTELSFSVTEPPVGPYRIVIAHGDERDAMRAHAEVLVKTYRDVLGEYRTHPESKSLGPDGQPCNRATAGLLRRRPVKAAAIHHIGKESNKSRRRSPGSSATSTTCSPSTAEPGQDTLW